MSRLSLFIAKLTPMRNRLLALALMCFISSYLAHATDTTHVLFIGNSYTYFWNLPQVTEALSHNDDHDIVLSTAQSTVGGANLGQHWRGERGLASREILKERKWDYVVLQDHSLRSLDHPDSLEHYVSLWVKEIQAQEAVPLLYLTWSRSYHPHKQEKITTEFERIGKLLDVRVVPVGRAWELARSFKPDYPLYDPDGSHPAPLGTYLTALTFYREIVGVPATDLPPRLISSDHKGEKLYLMITPPAEAVYCQDIVELIYNPD